MSDHDKYDLKGLRGAENFRELEPGVVLELVDGALGQVVENARDGAVVFVSIVEDANSPDRVGEEQVVLFNEVTRVVRGGQDD
jgi:hypothetical protein